MFALSIDFACVELPKPPAVQCENGYRLTHGRINLPCVSEIEAERCIGQLLKNGCEIGGSLPDRLTFIHIFDIEQVPESRPFWSREHRVRMNNNRPPASVDQLQQLKSLRFIARLDRAWSMKRNETKPA